MHRSHISSVSPYLRGALTLFAFPLLMAASAPLNSHAARAVSPASPSSLAPAVIRDSLPPDQQFLRNRSDEQAGMALLAHETLHRPGDFPSKADAKRLDQRVDDETDRVRAALKGIYNDPYVGKPRTMAHVLADSIMKLTGATYDSTFRKWVIEYDRLLILSIDRAMPTLTNADVKALAQKMRASSTADMATLKTEQAAG